jgi:MarR family transcriptional regulator, organic hydroperoxide resistance regulator
MGFRTMSCPRAYGRPRGKTAVSYDAVMRAKAEHPDPSELTDVLQFMRLLWAVGHGLQTASKRMEQQIGVTGPQRLVIRVLGQFPGLSAGALAELLHLHPSTLTGVLARLEKRRLIQRSGDPTDRRRTLLTLTSRGAAIDRLRDGTAEMMVRSALRGTSARARAHAQEVLTRVAAGLEPRAAERARPTPRRRRGSITHRE